jgi:hypothetical protein
MAMQDVKHVESCFSKLIHLPKEEDLTQVSKGNERTLEGLLCNLNSLVSTHLQEWLALPQSERMDAVLKELKKL